MLMKYTDIKTTTLHFNTRQIQNIFLYLHFFLKAYGVFVITDILLIQ